MIEITEELALFLVGKLYTDRSYFNPIQIEELWYISTEEIEFCTNEEIKPLLPPL
jgi:hypothetical protein